MWVDTLSETDKNDYDGWRLSNPDSLSVECTPEIFGEALNPSNFPICGFADYAALEAYMMEQCPGEIQKLVSEWLGHIITGVAIVVVAVPEGLPLAVMLSLAYSV